MDDERAVLEVVKEGVASTVAILDEYNRLTINLVFLKFENADKMQQLMDRQAQLQDEIDAVNAELDTWQSLWMLRTPPSDRKLGFYLEESVEEWHFADCYCKTRCLLSMNPQTT